MTSAAVLAALFCYVAVVYLVIVVAGGALLPASRTAAVALTFMAAALVAVTLEPLRNRLGQLRPLSAEDRLVQLTTRHLAAEELTDALQQLCRLVAKAVRAVSVSVRVELGPGLTAAGHWPDGIGESNQTQAPAPADAVISRPLLRGTDRLGELTVRLAENQSLSPVEDRLVEDAVNHAALLVDVSRMDSTLRTLVRQAEVQHEELQRSRLRILAVMEAERVRVERDIHDGAQQHLVALAINLRLLAVLLDRDPERARVKAESVRIACREAVDTLRQLSRGMYPTSLVAGGPVAALRAAAAASPVPVTVSAEHEWRWTPDLERAVYFSCIEALQNAVKHADAAAIQVRVQPEVDAVTFEVRDDGHGFDPVQHPAGSGTVNMRDRVESIGGSLWVESTDQGTTVTGRIPFRNGEPSSPVAEI